MNIRLAAFLAWRSLSHHRTVAVATILGVAIGMTVVAAILIVDYHSTQSRIRTELTEPLSAGAIPQSGSDPAMQILEVTFERGGQIRQEPPRGLPSQKGQARKGLSQAQPPSRRGEEDYQAMRLAVRLASLLAFSVGAVIVFYTMRFSVASRSREFSLLLCLGEKRSNVALSLFAETLVLGLLGTLLGLAAAFPASLSLINHGISTTGRVPRSDFSAPWLELSAMAGLSVLVALLAVVGPCLGILGMKIVDVLQPRFLSAEVDERSLQTHGFSLLLPPLMAAAYLAMRPFLLSWLTVVQFFLFESVFALLLALAMMWWMTPLLSGLVRLVEVFLKPSLPLEALLAGRRMRLTGRKLVFTIAGVTLVFSLLTALHDITRSLKHEIQRWSDEALLPYIFLKKTGPGPVDREAFNRILARHDLFFFRLSDKIRGEFPIRLIDSADVNPFLADRGRPPLRPGMVIVSRTMAARFDLKPGDRVIIRDGNESHRFAVIDVTDAVGFFAEDDQYVDLKSYLLFSDGNPIFAGNLQRTLGDYGAVRKKDGSYPGRKAIAELSPFYFKVKDGYALKVWQKAEIDRDFLIFDFILAMTIILAAVGVCNNILIQVHARGREFSVLRTLGVSRAQTMRLLLVEGFIIGSAAAIFSLVLGNSMGAISVSFLDRFTLFEYDFVFSISDSFYISLLSVIVCSVAALYPAIVANSIHSAESLHYE